MEKNIEKNVQICVTSHFAVHQRLTQHCKSTINKKKKRKENRVPEGFPSILLLTLIGGYMSISFYLLKCTLVLLCDYTKHH